MFCFFFDLSLLRGGMTCQPQAQKNWFNHECGVPCLPLTNFKGRIKRPVRTPKSFLQIPNIGFEIRIGYLFHLPWYTFHHYNMFLFLCSACDTFTHMICKRFCICLHSIHIDMIYHSCWWVLGFLFVLNFW